MWSERQIILTLYKAALELYLTGSAVAATLPDSQAKTNQNNALIEAKKILTIMRGITLEENK
jgi:hypothetical protein